jgi:hypothetical protein
MAYEMLTGELPFAGATTADYEREVLSGLRAPLQAYLLEAPARLQGFFGHALALDPSRHPGRESEFVAERERKLG